MASRLVGTALDLRNRRHQLFWHLASLVQWGSVHSIILSARMKFLDWSAWALIPQRRVTFYFTHNTTVIPRTEYHHLPRLLQQTAQA